MSSRDAYQAGQDARTAGRPHNPRNSEAWKRGYRDAHEHIKDVASDRFEDDWVIDPEMEAKG